MYPTRVVGRCTPAACSAIVALSLRSWLSGTESKLKATIAEQAAAIQRHATLTTHTDRHLRTPTGLVLSRQNVKVHELEHALVHSHVEAL